MSDCWYNWLRIGSFRFIVPQWSFVIQYREIKPRIYIETTVVSYLVARLSDNPTLASRQQGTRQLWDSGFTEFEFVVSDAVLDEVSQGDSTVAQRRLEALSNLTVLETLPEANILAKALIDAGVFPQRSRPDAQHIAIATTHRVNYLVSWNYRHIVSEIKRQHINQVCQDEGFQPIAIRTPIELMEEFQMKETPEMYTDPILEECYRMKETYAAQFKSMQELYVHLKAQEKKRKKQGWKYTAPPPLLDKSRHEENNDL